VFAGSFSRPAATEVANLEDTNRHKVGDALDHLVRRSLVVADIGVGDTRYRLLETMRHFAIERLDEAGETAAVARRHAEWYATHARDYQAVVSRDEARWLARGIAEWDNLRAAVSFARDRGDVDLAVRVVGDLRFLTPLWNPELLDWARAVLAMPGADDHPDADNVYLVVANLAWPTGNFEETQRAADVVLARTKDDLNWSEALGAKLCAFVFDGEFDEFTAGVKQGLRQVVRPEARLQLRSTAVVIGLSDEVDQLIAESDACGIPNVRAQARTRSAWAMLPRSAVAAEAMLLEALAILEPGLNRRALGQANETLSFVSAWVPDLDESAVPTWAGRALDLGREYVIGVSYGLIGLVVMAERLGRFTDASILAGYICSHFDELALDPRGTELMLRGPLERFAADERAEWYARGEAMSPDDLQRGLERLAGRN
jgi:hypothetical protein